jgi:CxxC motif-containing protein (DUF1111 family)
MPVTDSDPRRRTKCSLILLFGMLACGRGQPQAVAAPGEAVPGLSAAETLRFEQGRALFDRDFTEAEGLGPLFNQRRCSSCHDIPTPGGNGSERVTKVTRFDPPDRCDLLENLGGELLQEQVTDTLRTLGIRGESPPREATAVVSMHAPALYGLGLIEAVPDVVIEQLTDPDDADGDGISGRAVRLADGRLGRFGRKLRFATIRDFTEDALRGELGLTTPAHPVEPTLNGRPLPPELDPAPEPEVDDAVIDRLTDYITMLAAPAAETPSSPAVADSLELGAGFFHRTGCADCHTPGLATQSADVPALDGRRVMLYSDLLLHDMGEDLASICGPSAAPSEWRTAPLLGLRHRIAFLHDGSAPSFRRAIEMHGGEAANARLAFQHLTVPEQEMLLRFLASL